MNEKAPWSAGGQSLSALELLELYQLSSKDLGLIRSFAPDASPHFDALIGEWYEWLESLPEFEQFFAHLGMKAGIGPDALTHHPQIFTYQVEKAHDEPIIKGQKSS